jgi:hypothetical protein
MMSFLNKSLEDNCITYRHVDLRLSLALCLAAFLDQPSRLSARLKHVVICAWNSYYRKMAISSRYKWGFSSRWSQRALSITGVSLCGHPPLFGGAFTLPNRFRLVTCLVMELDWAPSLLLYEDDRCDLRDRSLVRSTFMGIYIHAVWRIRLYVGIQVMSDIFRQGTSSTLQYMNSQQGLPESFTKVA